MPFKKETPPHDLSYTGSGTFNQVPPALNIHHKNVNAVVPGIHNAASCRGNDRKKTIFVVDDSSTNLAIAEQALEKHYLAITLSSAAKMFTALTKITPNLILLDISMPEVGGFEAIKRLKANNLYADIPVIFLTGLNDDETEAAGIELGAVDFITKPFSAPVLLNRIKNHLYVDEVIHERTEQLRKRSEQLLRLQNGIVFTLADIVENRDSNTGGHIDRTAEYVRIFLNAMQERSLHLDEIQSWNFDSVVSSARLHDLGKVSIPDSILNKPDKLTSEEFSVIKTHPVAGERIIDEMISLSGDGDFLRNAKLIAGYHHEYWDGTGYPYGLKGNEIPLQGQIMSIVDVYDALTSQRPYKKAFTNEESLEIIKKRSGTHFDPQMVDLLFAIKDKLELMKVRLA